VLYVSLLGIVDKDRALLAKQRLKAFAANKK
jgi:hypothetical protein